MAVKVYVLYCGAWGYASKVKRLEIEIMDQFDADQINFSSEGTPGVTGYLEVSVNGELVHSKKNGDGYVDNQAKLQKILNAIQAAL